MGQSCVIVGVGPGIGMALARRFGIEGHTVALIGRDAEKLNRCAADLETQRIRSKCYPANAADEDSLRAAISSVQSDMGPVDVLCYNAYAMHPGTPGRLRSADVLADFQVNVLGALAAAQAVIPQMKEAGRGTILITGGGLGLNPVARFASLALGKAALRNLTFSLAQELEPAGIHVATVTVNGFVKEDTRLSPANIAETFYKLHAQNRSEWEREVVFQ